MPCSTHDETAPEPAVGGARPEGAADFDLHGLPLRLAGAAPLVESLAAILADHRTIAAGAGEYVLRVRYGDPDAAAGAGGEWREVWRGVLPDGYSLAMHVASGRRRIDLPGRARLAVDLERREGDIVVAPGHEAAAAREGLVPLLCAILAEAGQQVMHCACLALGDGPDAPALLLAGDSGAGKTTAALALARGGMRLLSDDATFVLREGAGPDGASAGRAAQGSWRVWGLRGPVKVRRRTLDLLPWLADLPRRPAALPEEYLVDVAGALPRAERSVLVRPVAVVLLEPPNPRGHALRPLDHLEAVRRLVAQNVRCPDAALREDAARTFRMLVELVQTCRLYALSAGPDVAGLRAHVAPLLAD